MESIVTNEIVVDDENIDRLLAELEAGLVVGAVTERGRNNNNNIRR